MFLLHTDTSLPLFRPPLSLKSKEIKSFKALAGVAQWIECWPATKGSLVRFPVMAHAWVAGQVLS